MTVGLLQELVLQMFTEYPCIHLLLTLHRLPATMILETMREPRSLAMLPFGVTVVYLSTTSCWYWLVLQWSLSTSQWGFPGWLAAQLMLWAPSQQMLTVTLVLVLNMICMSITTSVLVLLLANTATTLTVVSWVWTQFYLVGKSLICGRNLRTLCQNL